MIGDLTCPTCGEPGDAAYPQPDGTVYIACLECSPGYAEFVETLIDETRLGVALDGFDDPPDGWEDSL